MKTQTLRNAISLLVGLAVYGSELHAQHNEDGTINPVVKIQTQDYAAVHRSFRTKLIKETGSPQPVQPPDSADVPPTDATEVQFSSGQLKLKAWVNKPSTYSRQNFPVVVFLHGGFAFGKGDWDMTKPFRDAGFVVIAPMLRGENGQKGVFTLFYEEVADAIAAASYALQQPFIDKRRLYLAGHSVGGTIALLTALLNTPFRKATSFSASPDQVLYCKYGTDPKIIPFDTTAEKEFVVRSPLAYAGSFKIPVRMYYGEAERHFRLSTQQTATLAKQHGLNVAVTEVKGGHETALEDEIKLAIEFFNQKK